LRTPLAIMMAESDYILNRESSREELISHISGINRDLKKINRLITGLLELTQLENQSMVKFSEIRTDELLLDVIRQIKGKFPARKILPEVHYPAKESDLMITGNAGLLATVFMNLLENACKFSSGEITVKLTPAPGELTITFQDQGIGIPESEIRDVVKPFTRGSNAKHIVGSGIGLSLVARILELHHADFNLNSAPGKGTTVYLVFKNSGEKT